MTTYSKLTDFASKDALLTGNPAKIVKGVEIDDEFNAIATADATSVKGPIGATVDNTVARWDGTTGRLVQGSGVTISDADVLTTPTLSVTGNTTLGDSSTDTVTVNGYMGVGGAGNAGYGVNVVSTALTGSSQYGVVANPTFTAAATANATAVAANPMTAASATTHVNIHGIRAFDATKGAGSTITNLHGVYVNDQTQGTNNYGITSLVSSGTNKWNIYASGTAANLMAGGLIQTGFNAPTTGSALVTGYSAGGIINSYNYTTPAWTDLQIGALNLILKTQNTERARIDSAGNVGIGTSSPASGLDVGSAASDAVLSLTATGVQRWQVKTERSTGNFLIANQTGSTVPITVTTAGNLGLGITPTARNNTRLQIVDGIGFPATQVASSDANTLDDYEEGTFTPVIEGTSTAGTGTYSVQTGRYVKVGKKVTLWGTVIWSAHTGAGNIIINGIPFSSVTSSNIEAIGTCEVINMTLPANSLPVPLLASSQSVVRMYSVTTGTGTAVALAIDTAASIYFNITYETPT